ncbi:hypothetical protein HUJ04_004876 [Dendroctonus ponderosae]|nr:hypothetical protein HUJ04_004876 [Dendroctonus ponderosae]
MISLTESVNHDTIYGSLNGHPLQIHGHNLSEVIALDNTVSYKKEKRSLLEQIANYVILEGNNYGIVNLLRKNSCQSSNLSVQYRLQNGPEYQPILPIHQIEALRTDVLDCANLNRLHNKESYNSVDDNQRIHLFVEEQQNVPSIT